MTCQTIPHWCVAILSLTLVKFTKVILPVKDIIYALNYISKHFNFPFKNFSVWCITNFCQNLLLNTKNEMQSLLKLKYPILQLNM